MGALHEGHCSLVGKSIQENDQTIVLIFVNPSQFAPHEDLDAYPRNLEEDLQLLEAKFSSTLVDAIFIPKVSEMYPGGIVLDVEKQAGAFVSVLGVSEQLEGVTRPHFFRGVATVVTKLLNVVSPDMLYVGQKDAQQCVVLKTLVKDLLIPTEVRVVETLREKNGLAQSSRNAYLTPEVRDECSFIYKALCAGEDLYKSGVHSASEILKVVEQKLHGRFEVEYVAVSHPETLSELKVVEKGVGAIISTAVRVPRETGGIARLIDNVVLV